MSELALKLIREAKENRSTHLDLGNCGLTELPDELFELTWLEELILSSKWWEYSLNDIKEHLKYSENMKVANNIEKIPYDIQNLSKLKKLVASSYIDVHGKW